MTNKPSDCCEQAGFWREEIVMPVAMMEEPGSPAEDMFLFTKEEATACSPATLSSLVKERLKNLGGIEELARLALSEGAFKLPFVRLAILANCPSRAIAAVFRCTDSGNPPCTVFIWDKNTNQYRSFGGEGLQQFMAKTRMVRTLSP